MKPPTGAAGFEVGEETSTITPMRLRATVPEAVLVVDDVRDADLKLMLREASDLEEETQGEKRPYEGPGTL